MKQWFSSDRIHEFDRMLADWMETWGHRIHRLTLAGFFLWFGALKAAGYKSATSIIAHTVYFTSPEVMVPILGFWEMAIGACLIIYPLVRLALFLLAIRLLGTIFALILHADICFVEFPLVPSFEGQYLVKDFLLFAAALVIGGTIREEKRKPGVRH